MEVGRKESGQGNRDKQSISGAGTVIMGEGDGHGNGHVGGDQGRRESTAMGFDEGTGDVFAVQWPVLYEPEKRRGSDAFFPT